MNWAIVFTFLLSIFGIAGGFFTYISSYKNESTGCAVMMLSAFFMFASIVLGIGAIAWRAVGG
jgi:hypothetical protein